MERRHETMRRITWMAVGALTLATLGTAGATAVVGQPAPGFTAKDQDGHDVDLAQLRGKIVVLEWTNPDCPFVRRHYGVKTMSTLSNRFQNHEVFWLAVNSTNY